MKRILVFAVVMMAVCLSGYGQEIKAAEPNHAAPVAQELGHDQRFRLTFVVREADEKGKVLNSREYEAMIAATPHHAEPNASIRTAPCIAIWMWGSTSTFFLFRFCRRPVLLWIFTLN
jgi:hypothetical protein